MSSESFNDDSEVVMTLHRSDTGVPRRSATHLLGHSRHSKLLIPILDEPTSFVN